MLFSIVIPIYNLPEYLIRECIESCVNQDISPSDYEIICVDDGSTDNCVLVLNEYKAKYSNIRVITQENMGISGARNTGIDNSQGIYIWFVDGDDFIAENSLGKLKRIVNETNVERLHLGRYHFHESLSNDERSAYETGVLRAKYNGATIFVTSSLYKKSFLKENNFRFRCEMNLAEDLLFNFELDQVKHDESKVDDIFYFYRIRENSLSHSSDKTKFAKKFIESHLIGCKVVKSYYDKDIVKKVKTVRYLHNSLGQIMIKISQLDHKQARKYLNEILSNNLFPYKKWSLKGLVFTFYTNVYSFFVASICKLSTLKILFWMIKLYSKIWSSKTKKRIEKWIKKKII